MERIKDILKRVGEVLEESPNILHLRGEGRTTPKQIKDFLDNGRIPPHLQEDTPPKQRK